MAEYLVRWEIELDAETPEAAALLAREIQQDRNNRARVYDVHELGDPEGGVRIDLDEVEAVDGYRRPKAVSTRAAVELATVRETRTE